MADSGGIGRQVILAGFGLARFQSGALLSGAIDKLLRPLAQILVPYYLIVAGYALAWGDVPWASVFLVGNFGIADPGLHGMVPYLYWFIEAYCQMLLVFGALFAVPFVRRAAAKRPLAVGMALFAAAFAARMAFPLLIESATARYSPFHGSSTWRCSAGVRQLPKRGKSARW